MKRPQIKTELPGPEARRVLERDKKFISPSYSRPYEFVMKMGHGVWVYDIDDNLFLDMNAGIAVLSTGHTHPEIVKVIEEQAEKFIHYSGTDFYYKEQVDLAQKLAEIVPGAQNKKAFLTNSGTESIETAMKLARYKTKRPIFLAFHGCFHGRSLGALSLTASKAVQRRYFSPLLPQVVHIPFPDAYRPPLGATKDNITDTVLDYLENVIFHQVAPPEDVAAFFIEPVQGEGGYIVAPLDFFSRLKSLLDKYDILLVDDEIQSGMGRTGKMFGIEHYGVIPDIVAVAKGIASGMPLGAAVARTSLMDWEPGAHANTFGGNPISCVAALKTIELLEGGLIENAEKMGGLLMKGLKEIQEKYEIIGDVRGFGLMIGVEIVKDKNSKERAPELSKSIIRHAFHRGLLLLPAGDNTVRFSPPLVIGPEEVTVALEIFEEAVKASLGGA